MKIAVFPGSFDPITKAHVEIIKRGLGLFDKIYIAIGVSAAKKGFLSNEERIELIQKVFGSYADQVVVESFSGLTVEYCRSVGAKYILRGIRNTQDFDFENSLAQNNKKMAPEIETYFLISDSGYGHISSTIVRDVWRHRGDISSMVPLEILEDLMKKPNP